ncbi:MAG: hypothetical protein IJR99_17030 [Kiritimatiellae bacterium]|nr:hypothetical protein [Kiritimatiellia bacterium]
MGSSVLPHAETRRTGGTRLVASAPLDTRTSQGILTRSRRDAENGRGNVLVARIGTRLVASACAVRTLLSLRGVSETGSFSKPSKLPVTNCNTAVLRGTFGEAAGPVRTRRGASLPICGTDATSASLPICVAGKRQAWQNGGGTVLPLRHSPSAGG